MKRLRKLTKREAGRRGGFATFKAHGVDHMSTIGKEGAKAFWKKYRVTPAGTSGWALVHRLTGVLVRFIGTHPARIRRSEGEED